MTRRALEIAKQMESLLLEAQKSFDDSWKDESKVAREISALTHELEIHDFNPFQAFVVMQKFQALLRERREIKHDQWALKTMMDTYGGFRKHIPTFTRARVNVEKLVAKQGKIIQNRGMVKQILMDDKARRKAALDVIFPDGGQHEEAQAEQEPQTV